MNKQCNKCGVVKDIGQYIPHEGTQDNDQEKQTTINNRRQKYFDAFKEPVEQKGETCYGCRRRLK